MRYVTTTSVSLSSFLGLAPQVESADIFSFEVNTLWTVSGVVIIKIILGVRF